MSNVAPFSEPLLDPDTMARLAERLTSGEALPLATWLELVEQIPVERMVNASSPHKTGSTSHALETPWWAALGHALDTQDLQALAQRLREPEAARRFRSDAAEDQAGQREIVSRALRLTTDDHLGQEIIVGMLLAAGATPVLNDITLALGGGNELTAVNERLFDRVMDALEQRLGPCSNSAWSDAAHVDIRYADLYMNTSMLWRWTALVKPPAWGLLGETSAQVQRRVRRLVDLDPHALDAPDQRSSFWTWLTRSRHRDPTSLLRTRWAMPTLLERGLLGPLPLNPETLRRIFSRPFKDMIEPTLTFLMAQEALNRSSGTLALHTMCAADLRSDDDEQQLVAALDTMAQQGIDLHGVDAAGNHALHILATHSAHVGIARWLVERGVDAQATNRAGQTPLDLLMAAPDSEDSNGLALRTFLESLALRRATPSLPSLPASTKPRL